MTFYEQQYPITYFADNNTDNPGFYIKKFLISDKPNLNKWCVTWDDIKAKVANWIGKPVVLTPTMSHPPMPIQEMYRVGTIVDVGLDEERHMAWHLARIDDQNVIDMIHNGKVRYGSAGVLCDESDMVRDEKSGVEVLSNHIPQHVALVSDPAYGKDNAVIRGTCTGTESTCKTELRAVTAEVNDSAIGQITTVQFIQDILKKRYRQCTISKMADGNSSNSNNDNLPPPYTDIVKDFLQSPEGRFASNIMENAILPNVMRFVMQKTSEKTVNKSVI